MRKLRGGTLPEERAKLMSYLSMYEPDYLPLSLGGSSGSSRSINGGVKDVDVGSKPTSGYYHDSHVGYDDDMLRDPCETVKLEEELARYLRARGITKDFSRRNDDDYGEPSMEELNLGSDRIPEPRENRAFKLDYDEEDEEVGAKMGNKKGWSKDALAKDGGGVKVISGSRSGKHGNSGGGVWDGGVAGAQTGMDVDNPRAKFIGEAEPRPNSREAMQLEHLSRLLFDGEEPEDFVFGQSTLQ